MENNIKRRIICGAIISTIAGSILPCKKCHKEHQPHIPESHFANEATTNPFSIYMASLSGTATIFTGSMDLEENYDEG